MCALGMYLYLITFWLWNLISTTLIWILINLVYIFVDMYFLVCKCPFTSQAQIDSKAIAIYWPWEPVLYRKPINVVGSKEQEQKRMRLASKTQFPIMPVKGRGGGDGRRCSETFLRATVRTSACVCVSHALLLWLTWRQLSVLSLLGLVRNSRHANSWSWGMKSRKQSSAKAENTTRKGKALLA